MNKVLFFLVSLLLVAGAFAACSTDDGDSHGMGSSDGDTDTDGDTDADGGGDADTDSDTDWPGDTENKGCKLMDILFIVDDSGSMACEQEKLSTGFPGFIDVLQQYGQANSNGLDYRIGVTTTGKTANITFSIPIPGFPDVPMPQTGMNGKLIDVSGEPNPWIDGPDASKNISSLFSQTASVGTSGPSYEMPLAALDLFLDKTEAGEHNDGFLREEAVFVVVIITDEDDCSHPTDENKFTVPDDNCMSAPNKHNLVELAEYEQRLTTTFGDGGYVVVTIAGASDCDLSSSTCSGDDTGYAGAMKADRLIDFMENYIGTGDGRNGVFADLCTVEIPEALQEALDKMEVVCDEYPGPV